MTLCVLILAAALAWAAVEAPADLKLGPPEGMKASKTLVEFSHAKHGAANVECATCHHTWDGKSKVQSCAAPVAMTNQARRVKPPSTAHFTPRRQKTAVLVVTR